MLAERKMAQFKNVWLRMVAVLCLLVLLCQVTPTTVYARDLTDIQAEIKEKKDKLESLENTITNSKNNRAAAEAALVEYQAQYEELLGLIDEQEVLINQTVATLDLKADQLNDTVESINANNQLFQERLRTIYELNRSNAMLTALLNVSSFSELMQVSDVMKRISQKDTELLEDLSQKMDNYELQLSDLNTVIDQLTAELQNLQADRDWCTAKIEEMNQIIATANYNIQISEQKTQETQAEIQALQAEYARIFQTLQQAGSQKGDSSVRYDGPLQWPVGNGYKRISSYYGDPRSNTGWHYGIDIPGPEGTPILASGSGTVITAEWHYSYGYYVVIDHGQGLRTLYAHNSRLLVTAGNYVVAGQQISEMGNTGDSFGSHLHFEVHENGQRQNPLQPQYLNPIGG